MYQRTVAYNVVATSFPLEVQNQVRKGMIHPWRKSRLHILVVDGVYGGNIVDRGVQECEERCVLGWFVH